MAKPGLRRLTLELHLYIAIACSVVLLCAGLSGAVLALGPELERVVDAHLRSVAPAAQPMSERDLATRVERAEAACGDPAGIERIEFGGARESQVFMTRSGIRVFVDPYRGTILGRRTGPTRIERILDDVFQLHVRLLAGNAGEMAVDVATVLLVLSVATGVVLWWKQKRIAFRRGTTWRQWNWDLHNLLGIYAGTVVLSLGLSGLLLAWEPALYWMVNARPEREPPLPHSVIPADARRADAAARDPGELDAWLAAADHALPHERTIRLQMPMTARSVVQVTKRGPGGFGQSVVYVDRYDARVLRVDELSRAPRAYRAHVLNRALHTGDIGGLPSRVLVSFASLAMTAMVVTGLILWLMRIVRGPHSPYRHAERNAPRPR